LKIFFSNAKVYLFGSRATPNYKENSDIDIAINAGSSFSLTQKSQLITTIDALNMPQKIDLVDFNRAPKSLQESILKKGILWKS